MRGPSAWLWSHGYEFREREADIRRIFAGTDDALELIRYYKIDFVYFGETERNDLKGNVGFFESHFPVLYRSPNITIYSTENVVGTSVDANPSLSSRSLPRELASRLGKDPHFLLLEFPRVSYRLCRFYRVALGRLPKYSEFMADMSALGRGLFVGAPGWQQVLASNQNALLKEWQNRKDVQALYDTRSNEQYVDALISNAGLPVNNAERAALISSLDAGSQTRPTVLRLVAGKAGSNSDYNAAYVLLHYFAYLGRNPEDPPDNSLAGYDFWLTDLNSTGDYRALSRVFIESDEYKNRPLLK